MAIHRHVASEGTSEAWYQPHGLAHLACRCHLRVCAELPYYRQVVVANLPGLEKLDNVEVTEDDRRAAHGMPLLQAATYAELEQLMEGWELEPQAGGTGSQQHQQSAPNGVGPGLQQAPRAQLAAAAPAPNAAVAGLAMQGEAVGAGARSASAGPAAPSSDSYGSGATIGITVPGRPSSCVGATSAGTGGSSAAGYGVGAVVPELYPQQQQQQQYQEQYNPQRYSSQLGSQAGQVPSYQSRALPAADYAQVQQAPAVGQHYQSSSTTPARSRSPAGGSSNVLYAVMALLADLDSSQLGVVWKEVEQRLASLRLP
jgi:hypothetical protein